MKTINNKLKTLVALPSPLLGRGRGRLFLGLVGLLLFASCSQDELGETPDPTPQAGDKITFNIGFAPQMQTRVATDAQFNSTWETGDEVGLYITKGNIGLGLRNWVDNVKLERQDNGTWEYTLPSGKEYYPNDGQTLSFYAYYPYDAGMRNPTGYSFNVPIDQVYNDGEYYKKNDFLWAKLENVSKSDNAVTLQFSHALAMIEFIISHYDNASLSLAVNLLEAKTQCSINLENQHIAPKGTTNTIQMWQRLTDNRTLCRWALVPPQTMDIRFVWTKNNIPYTVTPATNVTLTSGKTNKYTTDVP